MYYFSAYVYKREVSFRSLETALIFRGILIFLPSKGPCYYVAHILITWKKHSHTLKAEQSVKDNS